VMIGPRLVLASSIGRHSATMIGSGLLAHGSSRVHTAIERGKKYDVQSQAGFGR